jgi:hypothetical protein
MLRLVDLLTIDVSEELSASIIRVIRIGELITRLAVTSNRRDFVFLRSVLRLLVGANVVPSSPILFTLMMEMIHSSEISVLTRATRRHVPKDGILHCHRRENVKSYIAFTGPALQWGCNVSPVWYELGFYIAEDGIFRSHRRENLISYIEFTRSALKQRDNMSPVRYALGCYFPEDDSFHRHRHKDLKS